MQAFLRRLFSFRKPVFSSPRPFSTSQRMSSSSTAASLYVATISPASITGAVPEEAQGKEHHLKDGKGFRNPWVWPLLTKYPYKPLILMSQIGKLARHVRSSYCESHDLVIENACYRTIAHTILGASYLGKHLLPIRLLQPSQSGNQLSSLLVKRKRFGPRG